MAVNGTKIVHYWKWSFSKCNGNDENVWRTSEGIDSRFTELQAKQLRKIENPGHFVFWLLTLFSISHPCAPYLFFLLPQCCYPASFSALCCRDFSFSLQLTFRAAALRIFRIKFIFSEAHSVVIFSVQYVASKDIQTSDLKRVGNAKPRERISDTQISSRLMPIDVIETEGCVWKLSF